MLYQLLFGFMTLIIMRRVNSASCCDRSRSGYVEFMYFAEYLHSTDLIESHFEYNNLTDVYSIEKESVILFHDNQYYFDDYYEQYENRTKVCIFRLYSRYDEIDHVIFNDGSRPRQIVFGCHSHQECCEIGCCSINNYVYFWVLYPCVIFLVLISKYARKRRNQETNTSQSEHDEL